MNSSLNVLGNCTLFDRPVLEACVVPVAQSMAAAGVAAVCAAGVALSSKVHECAKVVFEWTSQHSTSAYKFAYNVVQIGLKYVPKSLSEVKDKMDGFLQYQLYNM